MTRKICSAFALALSMGILPAAMPWMVAQASAEKSAAQQNPPEKNAAADNPKENGQAEKSRSENSTMGAAGFPQPDEPIELQSGADKRINLKMTDNARVIYQTIGQQAGISVLFDPDYATRTMSIDLTDVPLNDALKMVALESRTFWRPVTSNSIFVASDNPTKRREFEQQVVKTFYLPNLTQPSDFQDIVNTMRALLQIDRIQQLASHNTITVRGTPDQMVLVQKLIDDVNEAKKKTGQYRLEFKINEMANQKKLNSKNYVLVIEPHQTGKLRIGSRVPFPINQKQKQYIDTGKNIDSQVTSESDHTVGLRMTVEFNDVGAANQQVKGGIAWKQRQGDPAVKEMRMETSATLELGKPTLVGTLDDPLNNHTFEIEVTATRLDGFKGSE